MKNRLQVAHIVREKYTGDLRKSIQSLKSDISSSFRLCSRDFALLGQELITALSSKLKRYEHYKYAYQQQNKKPQITHEKPIRLICRMRPNLIENQKIVAEKHIDKHEMNGRAESIHIRSHVNGALPRKFYFSRVFDKSCTQLEVFEAVSPMIHDVVYNASHACVFSYGQTGSGKTFTMQGIKSQPGMYHHTSLLLFHLLDSQTHCIKYQVTMQMVELYNDDVYDLLFMEDKSDSTCNARPLFSPNARNKLKNVARDTNIRDIRHSENGIYVENGTKVHVHNAIDVQRVIESGVLHRKRTCTAQEEKSRSHIIVTLNVYQQNSEQRNGKSAMEGRIVLVDLAGSEKLTWPEKSGLSRIREAKYINKSLSAVSDVMSALQSQEKYIPYRNTKLTYLLQDSLSRVNRQVLMIVHVNLTEEDVNETLNSLKFAERICEDQHITNDKGTELDEKARLNKIIISQQEELKNMQIRLEQEVELKRRYERQLEEYREGETARLERSYGQRKARKDRLSLPYPSAEAPSSPINKEKSSPHTTRRWSLHALRSKEPDRYEGSKRLTQLSFDDQENVNANILSSEKSKLTRLSFSPRVRGKSVQLNASKNPMSQSAASEPVSKKRPAVQVRSILKKHRTNKKHLLTAGTEDEYLDIGKLSKSTLTTSTSAKQVSFHTSPSRFVLSSPSKIFSSQTSPFPISASPPLRQKILDTTPRAKRAISKDLQPSANVVGPPGRVRAITDSTPGSSRVIAPSTPSSASKSRRNTSWK